eukprot:5001006-Alexandrium_andersonii.AAC.1
MGAGVGSVGRAGVAVLARADRSIFPSLRLLGADVFRLVVFTRLACAVFCRRRSANERELAALAAEVSGCPTTTTSSSSPTSSIASMSVGSVPAGARPGGTAGA